VCLRYITSQAKPPHGCEPQIAQQTRRNPFFPKTTGGQKVSEKPRLANLAKKKKPHILLISPKKKETDSPFQKKKPAPRMLTRKKQKKGNKQ
jgi:hypothetical protein